MSYRGESTVVESGSRYLLTAQSSHENNGSVVPEWRENVFTIPLQQIELKPRMSHFPIARKA